jgi:hypothetical protein
MSTQDFMQARRKHRVSRFLTIFSVETERVHDG